MSKYRQLSGRHCSRKQAGVDFNIEFHSSQIPHVRHICCWLLWYERYYLVRKEQPPNKGKIPIIRRRSWQSTNQDRAKWIVPLTIWHGISSPKSMRYTQVGSIIVLNPAQVEQDKRIYHSARSFLFQGKKRVFKNRRPRRIPSPSNRTLPFFLQPLYSIEDKTDTRFLHFLRQPPLWIALSFEKLAGTAYH